MKTGTDGGDLGLPLAGTSLGVSGIRERDVRRFYFIYLLRGREVIRGEFLEQAKTLGT